MPLDTVTNTIANAAKLFRPAPASHLQGNLANYYQKTSQFVEERFKEYAEGVESKQENHSGPNRDESNDSIPRLNPRGVGYRIDLYV